MHIRFKPISCVWGSKVPPRPKKAARERRVANFFYKSKVLSNVKKHKAEAGLRWRQPSHSCLLMCISWVSIGEFSAFFGKFLVL